MDKSARFFLLIDGCEVWGVYRLIFSFDSRGEIAEISSYFNHSKEYKSVPLKEEAAAGKAVDAGTVFCGYRGTAVWGGNFRGFSGVLFRFES